MHRHRTGQRLERRVGAHQQAGLVEQHHAHRAQHEPVVELERRAVGPLARNVLGGAVLHHHQIDGAACCVGQQVAGRAKPAFTPLHVEQAALQQGRHVGTQKVFLQALAQGAVAGPVFFGLQLDRVAAHQAFTAVAGEIEVGLVDVDESKIGILQGAGKRRLPVDVQRLARCGGQRRRLAGRCRNQRAVGCRRGGLNAQRKMQGVEPLPGHLRAAPVAQVRSRCHASRRATEQGLLQPLHRGRAQRVGQVGHRHARLAAQQPQRRGVGKADAAAPVEQQHRVGQAVEQRTQRRVHRPRALQDHASAPAVPA